jgi:predicted unusual protein kinase regulating ubiquinone biosynthesis (AarF/ABC1/UbiB family)
VLDNNNLPEVVTNKRYFINVNELANGDLQEFMLKEYDNYKKVNNALAQIYIAILSFHSIGYTHNDAHWGNFLYHKVKPGGYIKYVINGYDVYLENLGYLWVIWDYGQTTILDNLNIFITLDDYMKVIYAFNNKIHDGWVPNELRISKNTRDLVTKLSNIFKDIIKPKDKKRVKNVSFDVVLFESIINDTELFIRSEELSRDSKIINAKPYIIKN